MTRRFVGAALLTTQLLANQGYAQGQVAPDVPEPGAPPVPSTSSDASAQPAPAIASEPAPAAISPSPATSVPPSPSKSSEDGIYEPPLPPAPLLSGPIRSTRRWVIAGELGWNSLPGLGPTLSHNLVPEFSMDAGLGLSMAGLKLGLRARANLLRSAWTPVLGAGILYALGAGKTETEVKVDDETVRIRIFRSPYLQLVTGAAYTGRDGFSFLGTVGYALLLRDNTRLIEGPEDTYREVRDSLGSGVVIATGFGYAF